MNWIDISLLAALVWVVCGYLAFGYYQREYPTIADMNYESGFRNSCVLSLFGPFTLITAISLGYTKHGRKYK